MSNQIGMEMLAVWRIQCHGQGHHHASRSKFDIADLSALVATTWKSLGTLKRHQRVLNAGQLLQ